MSVNTAVILAWICAAYGGSIMAGCEHWAVKLVVILVAFYGYSFFLSFAGINL